MPEGTTGGAAGSGRRTEETDKKRGAEGRKTNREKKMRRESERERVIYIVGEQKIVRPGWKRERREERRGTYRV